MGRRGPAKQPTELRILRGDPSKEGKKKKEPRPPADAIAAPEYVTGLALEKWNQLAPQLLTMRVLTNVDLEALARYCALWQEWRKNLEICRRGGDTLYIRDEAGKIKYMQSTPAATMVVKLGTMLLRLEQEFGLTPSARTGVSVNASEEDDKLAAYFTKHA